MIKFLSYILMFLPIVTFPIGNYSVYLYSAFLLMFIDTLLAIAVNYIKGYKENNVGKYVTSKRFVLGIFFKFLFLSVLLLFSMLCNELIQIQIFPYTFIFYGLYELKSIDEKINLLSGVSIIDNIIKSLFFFKKVKKDLQND